MSRIGQGSVTCHRASFGIFITRCTYGCILTLCAMQTIDDCKHCNDAETNREPIKVKPPQCVYVRAQEFSQRPCLGILRIALSDMPRVSLQSIVLLCSILLGSLTLLVSGLGSACSAPLGSGDSTSGEPFWMENITHRGTSAFNSNPSGYQVFRNVKVGTVSRSSNIDYMIY